MSTIRVNVIFHSLYGHIYQMAEAVAEGARQAEDVQVGLYQVPETLSDEILAKMGAIEAKKSFSHIPQADMDHLAEAHAVIFGTPTRFGNMTAQMEAFLDRTGHLWAKGTLVGKVGSVFTSSNTQHGGQESTLLSFHNTLLHHGMIIVGLPYAFRGQSRIDEITGCSPYGASTIAGPAGNRTPSNNELDGARYQGRHVTDVAARLFR